MTDVMLVAGSFAITWLVIWLVSALAVLLAYPLLRKPLLHWHPATSSSMLLLLLAFPFLLSLMLAVMLFMPFAENSLVSAHCHEDCLTHVPLIHSLWVSISGLIVSSLLAAMVLRKLHFNLSTARQLMARLMLLGKDEGKWLQLEDDRPVVFTLGWWHSRIFVTRGLLQRCTAADLDIILRHEYAHALRLDNLRLLLGKLFLLVLPAQLADKLFADLHYFTESACDFAAAAHHGDLEVAETLLRVQKLVPAEFSFWNHHLVSAFTGSEVERRIRNLTSGRHHTASGHYGQAAFFVCFMLLGIALVDPLHHGIEWLLDLL